MWGLEACEVAVMVDDVRSMLVLEIGEDDMS